MENNVICLLDSIDHLGYTKMMKRKIFEILLLGSILFPISLASKAAEASTPSFDHILFISYILVSIPQIALIVYIMWLSKEPLAYYGIAGIQPHHIGWTAGAFFMVLAILMLGANLVRLLPPDFLKNIYQRPQITLESAWLLIPAFFFCIVVGYKEELFFRSFVFTRLTELKVPAFAAVLLTSVVFGLLHFYMGLYGIILATILGVVFQEFYIQTKNIHVIAIAHALFNFFQFVIAFAAKDLLEAIETIF